MAEHEHADEPADGAERFTDRADDYAAHRPGYPEACVQALLRGMGAPEFLVVADVGAGTGIMARLLADAGARVVAIEPNASMRAKAADHERVTWHDGTAEATGLKDGSVDLVVCAQAFHWFDPPAAFAEFRRVLKGTGRLALVWNEVDASTQIGAGYREILDGLATDETPRVRYAAQEDPFAGTDLFDDVKKAEFSLEMRHSRGGLIGRALSASYAPKSGPAHDALIERLGALHAAHADGSGAVRLAYVTTAWTAAVKGEQPLVRVETIP
jgi:SAM-dependent methyltransferase